MKTKYKLLIRNHSITSKLFKLPGYSGKVTNPFLFPSSALGFPLCGGAPGAEFPLWTHSLGASDYQHYLNKERFESSIVKGVEGIR